MATLWIREYSSPPSIRDTPIAPEPGVDQTPVTFTTSTASAAFGSQTKYIAMIGSAAFHYVIGDAPVATTGSLKVPADTLLYVSVEAGDKVAAIAAA